MEKKICRNCKFWATDHPAMSAHGQRLPHTEHLGRCCSPGVLYGPPEMPLRNPTIVLVVRADWGLLTGPQFGCIHFEVWE